MLKRHRGRKPVPTSLRANLATGPSHCTETWQRRMLLVSCPVVSTAMCCGSVPPPPQHFKQWRAQSPYRSIWLRGWPVAACQCGAQVAQLTGAWGSLSEGAVLGTDASGGPHSADPQKKVLTTTVIVARFSLATAVRALPPGTAVPEACAAVANATLRSVPFQATCTARCTWVHSSPPLQLTVVW